MVGRVVVPPTDHEQGSPAATADVLFLVDTGAATTMLSPVDYEDTLGLSIPNAPVSQPSEGVGGIVETRSISEYLFLQHEDGAWSGFPLDYSIPETPTGQPPLPTSLLGRD
ncbi:MAG: hypothetical protein ACR2PL_11350, partial [Dehalococcoidia bacterium]